MSLTRVIKVSLIRGFLVLVKKSRCRIMRNPFIEEAMDEALREAAQAAGGYHALGRRLGISGQAIWQWGSAARRSGHWN